MRRFFISLVLILGANNAVAGEIDIFDAARDGDGAKIQQYVASGKGVNVVNEDGYTPFILATYYDRTDTAATLLNAGADPCAVDVKGSNAFMGMAFKGHVKTGAWMLKNTKCDINHRNGAGQTALMMASLFGQDAFVELLLKNGADVTITDKAGNTASTLANGQGLTHIVDMIRFVGK